MFPFILFTLLFGAAAGSTLDQTVPEVHDFTAKYIVGADHSDGPVNEGINDGTSH